MKLLQRTGLYFMGFSLLILLLGGIGIFYSLQYMLDHEMDESLHHTRAVLHKELTKMESLPPVVEIMDEVIDIHEVDAPSPLEIYQDTLRYVEEDGEMELETFRQYIYIDNIKGKNYRIALNHSKFDSEHLLTVITGLIIGFLALFFLVLNLFNRFLSQKLWQPFYHTINQIRQYSFAQPDSLTALPSSIDEFKTLDAALAQMANKLNKDYQSLKQFTENASHEIQTPLAIIRSQIDLLLQKEQDKSTLPYIQQIQQSATKLSKLNQSLLLLTRIENRQFEQREKLDFAQTILQKIDAMDILIAGKGLTVEKELTPTILNVSPILADVVISNLLSNAIRHNIANGKIQVFLNKEKLVVRNTGTPTTKSPKELFERFRKSNDASKTLGLGLAIVKEICELYAWKIDYQNTEDWHEITIDLQP